MTISIRGEILIAEEDIPVNIVLTRGGRVDDYSAPTEKLKSGRVNRADFEILEYRHLGNEVREAYKSFKEGARMGYIGSSNSVRKAIIPKGSKYFTSYDEQNYYSEYIKLLPINKLVNSIDKFLNNL